MPYFHPCLKLFLEQFPQHCWFIMRLMHESNSFSTGTNFCTFFFCLTLGLIYVVCVPAGHFSFWMLELPIKSVTELVDTLFFALEIVYTLISELFEKG